MLTALTAAGESEGALATRANCKHRYCHVSSDFRLGLKFHQPPHSNLTHTKDMLCFSVTQSDTLRVLSASTPPSSPLCTAQQVEASARGLAVAHYLISRCSCRGCEPRPWPWP